MQAASRRKSSISVRVQMATSEKKKKSQKYDEVGNDHEKFWGSNTCQKVCFTLNLSESKIF